MSYDLFIYKKEDSTITKKDIIEHLNQLPNIQKDEHNIQWFYENEATGVYCSFEYAELEEEEWEEKEKIEGFLDTQFYFSLNYLRPHFFAKESFPLVEELVNTLDLFVLDGSDDSVPEKPTTDQMISKWIKTNDSFSKDGLNEFDLCYLDALKSNYTWEFNRFKETLQDHLGEDYFVPRIFYIKGKKSNTVETMCVWPNHIPFVLPKVDYVNIKRTVKKLFRTKEEVGLVRMRDIMEGFGNQFSDEKSYFILHPNEAYQLEKEFNNLPIETTIEKFGGGIEIEKVSNSKSE